jgi:hypothetical protein
MSSLIRELTCNQPKATPDHPRKSHVVKACKDGKERIIRFGQAGVEGSREHDVDQKAQKRRAAHLKRNESQNANPDFFSARYWALKTKWS